MKLPCEAESFSFHGAEESAKIASLLNLVRVVQTRSTESRKEEEEKTNTVLSHGTTPFLFF